MYVSQVTNFFLLIFLYSNFIDDNQCVESYAIKKISLPGHICNSIPIQLSSIPSVETEWRPDYSLYKQDFPNLDASQWNQLENLSINFVDWNNKVNLVSRKDIQFLIPNHIIPCLSMSLIRNFAKGETVIDVGTGGTSLYLEIFYYSEHIVITKQSLTSHIFLLEGGLPGLPLAIACPNTQFTLIDSNVKKMMVVQDLADSLGLKNVRVICNRAEKLDERFDFMLGRAVSNLPNFLSFSSHLVDGKSKTPLTVVEQKSISLGITVGSGLLYLKGTLLELFILNSNY